MITIDQLLESVDLDFEPRWVTKDENGNVWLWDKRPIPLENWWGYISAQKHTVGRLKLAEFDDKLWQECIYEVPQKTDEYEQNLEKLRPADSDLVYRVKLPRKTTGKIEKIFIPETDVCADSAEYSIELAKRLNQVIDAVNELKSRAENVQPPCVRLYDCSDGAVFDNEDMAKSHEANLKSKQSMN